MANNWQRLAGATSVVLRLCAFVFLRWIPGHHFPPIILTALTVYLTTIIVRRESFKPTLHEAFPAVVRRQKLNVPLEDHQHTVEVKEVQIDYDDPVLYQDEQPFWKTLLWGIPDWSEPDFSYLAIATNLILALMTLDLVYRGPLVHSAQSLKFSRVGFVDDHSARLLFREPDPMQLPVYAYVKPDLAIDWQKVASIYYLGHETDLTHPIEIDGLMADTRYEYSLSNNLTGTFTTAPQQSAARSKPLTFLTSSCIKANFPYRPFANSLAIHGFEYLSDLIQQLHSVPAFMLFLGDFIYVDVPQRLGSTLAHYRSEYRRVYASPSWELPGIQQVPWLHTLDDHEIANDWSGGNQTHPFPEASDPFIHYHASVNPPIPSQAPNGPDTNTTYFEFMRGPASFFMLDTRRYRTNPERRSSAPYIAKHLNLTSKPLYGASQRSSNPPSPEEHPASMLGEAQLASLLHFIRRPEPGHVRWKFIASSVPFTKNWRFGTSDTWGGFLTERAQILDAMHEAEATLGIRMIVLSGDRHEFAAIRYPPPAPAAVSGQVSGQQSITAHEGDRRSVFDDSPQAGPHEFSVGPLSMFYLPIRTFRQVDAEDVAIAYFPDGNTKIGVISLENLAGHQDKGSKLFRGNGGRHEVGPASVLKYSLWVDGVVKWEYTLASPATR